jgi:hypothetical protein
MTVLANNRDDDFLNLLKVKGLLMNTGQREDGASGYDFDIGYYNMNCQFGTSLFTHDKAVYVGAPGQHHQGNVYRFDSEEIKGLLQYNIYTQVEIPRLILCVRV